MSSENFSFKFLAAPQAGEVSAILIRPANATFLLVFAHGAGSDMRHPMLQTIAERLADVGIATFRYNFPYKEYGRRLDAKPVCTTTVRSAVAAAHKAAPELPLLAGGHSFGGRMTSTAISEAPIECVLGLVFFAFPLYPRGKPGTQRADHLNDVTLPMLFLSGTRDELADLRLLQPVCKKLEPRAALHILDTADHGFRILKRSRKTAEDVFTEMARVILQWSQNQLKIKS